jgi:hypothetical protein
MDKKAAASALIAGLMSASWLPVFPYVYRHPELLKPHLPDGFFASQVLRPVLGIVIYAAAAILGWYVSRCRHLCRGGRLLRVDQPRH